MFKAGDAVIHPVRGAGVIQQIVEREWRGGRRRYYAISLLSSPSTQVMIPFGRADEVGLRSAVSEAQLKRMWRVLQEAPDSLPADYRKRFKDVVSRLDSGDIIMNVASTVRDMAWRQRVEGKLTIQGGRLYEQALSMLAGEVAASKGIPFAKAESTVKGYLVKLPEPAALIN